MGLARDSKYERRDEEPRAFVYRPLRQEPPTTPTFLIKSTLSTAGAANLMREQVNAVDPDVPVHSVGLLEERVKPWVHVAVAWVSGALGLLGAFLGAIGTYGLVSWSMHERRREFALRIALGASRSSIVRLPTGQGTKWAATGVVIGFVVFLGGTKLLQSFLRGVSAFDPISFAAVASVVLGVAYVACLLPAKRVSRADPVVALRE